MAEAKPIALFSPPAGRPERPKNGDKPARAKGGTQGFGDDQAQISAEARATVLVGAPKPGITIDGRFELIERLGGEDTMCPVFAAKDQQTAGLAVVKMFDQSTFGSNTEMLFQMEQRALESLWGASGVNQLIASGRQGERRYVATEYIPKLTVLGLIEKNGKIPWLTAAGIIRQAGVGLQEIHSRGMVHRDIKADNIMEDGTILDLGVTVPFEETAHSGTVIGTPAYMPQEQLHGRQLGPEADLYSLGVTLSLMVHDRFPFEMQDNGLRLNYSELPPESFASDPPIMRELRQGMLRTDSDFRLHSTDQLLAEIDRYIRTEADQYESFSEAVATNVAVAASANQPTAGTIIYIVPNKLTADLENMVNLVFSKEEGYTVYRSDRENMEGMFVVSGQDERSVMAAKYQALDKIGEEFEATATVHEIDTFGPEQGDRIFDQSSELVRVGRRASGVNVVKIDRGDYVPYKTQVDEPAAEPAAPPKKDKPNPELKRTSSSLGTADTLEVPPPSSLPRKAATLALAAIWGHELAEQINGQLATVDQDKLGALERELQGKIRQMSNEKFVEIMREAGLPDSEALKIKGQLDRFEFKQMKTGFLAMASGLLSMTAVSYLISKVSPDMNPGLHFAVVMLGGHYTKEGVKLLATKIRNREFISGVRELAVNVKNGRIVIRGLSRGALAALKAPLLTAGKAAGLLGKGVWAGVKATHGLGLGTLSAAGWKYLMDTMGVKNVYLREGGEMAAFLAPDAAKLSARYLVTVKGFKALSELMAKGALGTAAKAANVVGWAAFAADLTIGGIEHGMIKDVYTRSVIARAKEEWKDAQDGFFSIAGAMALDGLIGSFADAVVPQNYLDKVSVRDEQAITAFMEEIGKGVFLANLQGGSQAEVNKLIADHLKAFVATTEGKEYFEGMQALLKIKYGGSQNLTVCQRLISELDVSDPGKIVVTDQLSSALLTGTTFSGTYVKAQLRKASAAVEAGIPQS